MNIDRTKSGVYIRLIKDKEISHAPYVQSLQSVTEKTEISDVAQAVRRAVTDEITPMMLPAGADAERWFREEGLPLPDRPAAAGTTR